MFHNHIYNIRFSNKLKIQFNILFLVSLFSFIAFVKLIFFIFYSTDECSNWKNFNFNVQNKRIVIIHKLKSINKKEKKKKTKKNKKQKKKQRNKRISLIGSNWQRMCLSIENEFLQINFLSIITK